MFTITATDLFLSRAEAAKRCCEPAGGGGDGGRRRGEAVRRGLLSSPLVTFYVSGE